MDFTLGMPDLTKVAQDIESDVAVAMTAAMEEAGSGLKLELRDQVLKAGLAPRLATTWQGERYPRRGDSFDPAYYVWSKAPTIISAYVDGAIIRPTGGRKYLWIPTKLVPRAPGGRRATSTRRMSPEQVEARFNADFVMRKGKGGRLLAFIPQDRGITKRGKVRAVRKGRLAHGPTEQLLLMFTLVPTVMVPKKLDLDGPAVRWAAAVPTLFAERMR